MKDLGEKEIREMVSIFSDTVSYVEEKELYIQKLESELHEAKRLRTMIKGGGIGVLKYIKKILVFPISKVFRKKNEDPAS